MPKSVIASQLGLSTSRVRSIIRENLLEKNQLTSIEGENIVNKTLERLEAIRLIADNANSGKDLITIPFLRRKLKAEK